MADFYSQYFNDGAEIDAALLAAQTAMTKGAGGTYIQGVHFGGAGLPTEQEFVAANINNRYFEENLIFEFDAQNLPITQDLVFNNIMMGIRTITINTSVSLGRYLYTQSIIGGVTINSTAPQTARRIYTNYTPRFAMRGVKTETLQCWGCNRVVFQQGVGDSIEIGEMTIPGCFAHIEGTSYDITIGTANLSGSEFHVPTAFEGNLTIGNIDTVVGTIVDNRPGNPLDTFARKQGLTKTIDLTGMPGGQLFLELPAGHMLVSVAGSYHYQTPGQPISIAIGNHLVEWDVTAQDFYVTLQSYGNIDHGELIINFKEAV